MPVPVNTNEQVQALVDRFVVKGGFRLQLDETVSPVAVVAQLDNETSAGAIGSYDLTPVNFAHISLYNPSGAGVILELEQIKFSGAANTLTEVCRDGAIMANTSATSGWRDFTQGAVQPRGQVRYEDLAAVTGNEVASFWHNARQVVTIDAGWVMTPGAQVLVRNNVAANRLNVNFIWREVPI